MLYRVSTSACLRGLARIRALLCSNQEVRFAAGYYCQRDGRVDELEVAPVAVGSPRHHGGL